MIALFGAIGTGLCKHIVWEWVGFNLQTSLGLYSLPCLFSSFPFIICLDDIAYYIWASHTCHDGNDSMKSVQKLDSFGTGYIEVKKMTEEKIECGEGRKM